MSCDCNRLLDEYSKKLNLDEPLTIESLIEHHEHMRSLVHKMRSEHEKVLRETRARGHDEGRRLQNLNNLKNTIRCMTPEEVVELLGE